MFDSKTRLLLSPPHRDIDKSSEDRQSTSETKSLNKKYRQCRPVSKKQITDLYQTLKKSSQKNHKLLQTLATVNPYFTIKLYQSNLINAPPTQYSTVTIQILLGQIDLVLDDTRILQKQIQKCQIRKIKGKNKIIDEEIIKDHYAFLRKVWTGKSKDADVGDMIDGLNKKVAGIRNQVFGIAEKESKLYHGDYRKNATYYETSLKIGQLVSQTVEYKQLKEKYEHMGMKCEQLENRLMRIQQEKTELINENIKQNNGQQVQTLKRNVKQLKQKLLENQAKELALRNNLHQMQKEISEMRRSSKNIESNQNQNTNTPISLKIIESKRLISPRQKITLKDHLRLSLNIQSLKQCPIQLKEHQNKDKPKLDLPQQVAIKKNQQNAFQKYQQDFSDIRSVKSNKNTRFTRMRSPAACKLRKNRNETQFNEILSPRFTKMSVIQFQ